MPTDAAALETEPGVAQAGVPGETDPEWVRTHRRVWERKPALRWYYEVEQFARMRAFIQAPPVVEIGSGPGFLSRSLGGDVIALDVTAHSGVDLCADAHALPFADGSIGTFVAVDVLHHFSRPREVLTEVARALAPGGRFILIEPWCGAVSGLVYKLAHHEECVSVPDPWNGAMPPDKSPMDGNLWISKALLADRAADLPNFVAGLAVRRIEPFGVLSYLGSGGFQPWSAPAAFCRWTARIESWAPLSVRKMVAFRGLFVLEKTLEGSESPVWA